MKMNDVITFAPILLILIAYAYQDYKFAAVKFKDLFTGTILLLFLWTTLNWNTGIQILNLIPFIISFIVALIIIYNNIKLPIGIADIIIFSQLLIFYSIQTTAIIFAIACILAFIANYLKILKVRERIKFIPCILVSFLITYAIVGILGLPKL